MSIRRPSYLLTIASALSCLLASAALAHVLAAPAPADQPAADLPSAKVILEKYIEAIGGRAKLETIKSRQSTWTMDYPAMSMKADISMLQAEGGKFLNIIDTSSMGKFEQGSDGTTFWEINPTAGPRVLEGPELAMKRRKPALDSELNYEELFKKIETVGMEAVNDRPHYKVAFTYKVALTPEEGVAEFRFFDKETGLISKTATPVQMQGGTAVETFISDYREVDGIKLPFSVSEIFHGKELKMTMKEAKNNVEIPADTFNLPADIVALTEKPKVAPAPSAEPKKGG